MNSPLTRDLPNAWQRLKLHRTLSPPPFHRDHDPRLDRVQHEEAHDQRARRIVLQGTTLGLPASSSLCDRWDTTSFRSTSLPPSSLSYPGSASGNHNS